MAVPVPVLVFVCMFWLYSCASIYNRHGLAIAVRMLMWVLVFVPMPMPVIMSVPMSVLLFMVVVGRM